MGLWREPGEAEAVSRLPALSGCLSRPGMVAALDEVLERAWRHSAVFQATEFNLSSGRVESSICLTSRQHFSTFP